MHLKLLPSENGEVCTTLTAEGCPWGGSHGASLVGSFRQGSRPLSGGAHSVLETTTVVRELREGMRGYDEAGINTL